MINASYFGKNDCHAKCGNKLKFTDIKMCLWHSTVHNEETVQNAD